MKKQIILITRVYKEDPGEFKVYCDDSNKHEVKHENSNHRLIILRGPTYYPDREEPELEEPKSNDEEGRKLVEKKYKEEMLEFFKKKSTKLLQKVAEEGFDKNCETIIAYHDNKTHEDDFKFAKNKENWSKIARVLEYSSGGNNQLYENILTPLGDSIKVDNKSEVDVLIENLWNYFYYDRVLEEKLKLLQMILNGEVDENYKLNEEVQNYQLEFETLMKFDEVKNQDLFSKKYQEEYKKFRNSLNIN